MKRKPTGFVAVCQCGPNVGAIDYKRTDRTEAGKIIGAWLADGCTITPMFDVSWAMQVTRCACTKKPIAWLHGHPERYDVVHDKAKEIWLKTCPKQVEHYTIPLYLSERDSAWWALVMGAAAALEDAARCLTDHDAKRAAESAAKHYRIEANALWPNADVTGLAPGKG